jgi:endonuclease YncB( thermonuclease family)
MVPLPAVPTIYRWIDARGVTHFSDRAAEQAEVVAIEAPFQWYEVEYIYDGDTIKLTDGRKIRLLGINTPEIEGYSKASEPGGEAARDWLRARLGHQKVRLEWDTERQDKYRRWLAHVFDKEGHINLDLVSAGLASVTIVPPNLGYLDALLTAQRDAKANHLGIWRISDYAPKTPSQAITDRRDGWQRIIIRPKNYTLRRNYAYVSTASSLIVRIPIAVIEPFMPLEQFLDKEFEVQGWVSKNGDEYSILVRHPSAFVLQ